MAGSSKSNPPRPRKRIDAEINTLKRARDGSAFTKCEECNKDVPVALIDMHNCSLESRIKMHLESQVVEKVAEAKKPAPKKRAVSSSTEKSEKKAKKSKKDGRDPNMPKRPPTAFFLFMAEFREQFKETNPDSKKATAAAKEGGERWKSMTDEEKKTYVDRAAELKVEYEKAMEEYKAAQDDEVEEVDGPEPGNDGEECDEEDKECDKELEDDLQDDDAGAAADVRRVGKRVVLDDDDDE